MTQYLKAEPRRYLNKFYTRGGGGGGGGGGGVGGGLRPEVQPSHIPFLTETLLSYTPSFSYVLILSCYGFTNGTPSAYLIWNFAFLA